MSQMQAVFAALSAVVLFLYGLQGFSRELQAVGGRALQQWLGRMTSRRWAGFGIGALATALLQSSSAVSSLTTALVDAAVIPFRNSLAVLLGANVGTTATAWLVSFKLTGIGPVFIVLGALASLLPWRFRVVGKAVFYFGLVFFGLDLVASTLRPLAAHPAFATTLALAGTPWLGVFAGAVFTAVVQSSSVTTGLAILLVQQQLLPAEAAIPIVIGANVGSTSTALLASAGMRPAARATAISNLVFNMVGMLAFLPFLVPFSRVMVAYAANPAMAVALAHLVFNLAIALAFLLGLDRVEPRLRSWLLPATDPAGGPGNGTRPGT